MNWDHAWQQLADLIPPELSHHGAHTHPGISWWLKCAVPEHTQPAFYWSQIAYTHADLVHVCDHAYDWHGARIPGCVSVWIRTTTDVTLHVHVDSWDYEVHTFAQGQAQFAHNVASEIQNNCEEHTWHEIDCALHLLTTHVSHQQAHVRRKAFKVIHGKKATGHKRARPNLDSE
jgi:hypothetical protein